jgi:hypothetical protein
MFRSGCHAFLLIVFVLAPVAERMSRTSRAAEPSPEYRASLRRTLELRKQRRRAPVARPPGVIVPYPLPPSLIIRHRPEVHDEVEALLDLLRRSGG